MCALMHALEWASSGLLGYYQVPSCAVGGAEGVVEGAGMDMACLLSRSRHSIGLAVSSVDLTTSDIVCSVLCSILSAHL